MSIEISTVNVECNVLPFWGGNEVGQYIEPLASTIPITDLLEIRLTKQVCRSVKTKRCLSPLVFRDEFV